MFYVAAGLVAMFAITSIMGMQSVQQATDLVFAERLNTARTTAALLERGFRHVADDIYEDADSILSARKDGTLDDAAAELRVHLAETDSFAFLGVTGLWIIGADGTILAVAGLPEATAESTVSLLRSLPDGATDREFTVVPAVGEIEGGVAFATTVSILGGAGTGEPLIVAVHTISQNSLLPYVPSSLGPTLDAAEPGVEDSAIPEYHLEVVDRQGIAVLGIGDDENPGTLSTHAPLLNQLIADPKGRAMLHEPSEGESFAPHVLAIVPLRDWPFYLVLEQPADEALQLPEQLRQRLFIFMAVAALTVLVVAWITTRHVARPTVELTRAARRMADGDLDSPVGVAAQDEVGQLAESLEAMRSQLLIAQQQIETANRELESRVAERTARLSEVVGKVISAQEEERRRLARELHDETAQTLGALSISLDRARDGFSQGHPDTAERILEAKGISARLLEETQRLILALRPMVLDDLGLAPAVRWYAEFHLEENGIGADLQISEPPVRLPSHLEVAVFRIMQEAINNVIRHADASNASIDLSFADSYVYAGVSDDGIGFDLNHDLDRGPAAESVGLLGMRERVTLLNGAFDLQSEPGQGTSISIQIPIRGDG